MAQLTHRVWMTQALDQARAAEAAGDVPVGCVVVRDGEVVAATHNRREADADPTAHAEILALRRAAEALGSWRLDRCTVYVSLEPCPMCAGALVLARVPELVYATADPKAGAAGSLYDIVRDDRLNHHVAVTAGVLAEEASALLTHFFRVRRRASGAPAAATLPPAVESHSPA